MWRMIGSIIAGLVGWVAIVTCRRISACGRCARHHAAEATMQITLAMKIGRLTEAA